MDKPSEQVVDELVKMVIAKSSQRSIIKAILLQVYHHAIHNRYTQAKDLLLKTHMATVIVKQQIGNQICFNRAVVQTGMAAFRLGLFDESNQVLCDVAQTPRLREILGQGTWTSYNRNAEKTLEEELEEKKRFVPPHLQINLELLESVYLTSSMLLEVVHVSENKFTPQSKVISRNFRRLMEIYDNKGLQFVA